MCGVIIKKTKYGWGYVRNMYLISIHTNVYHSSQKTLSRKEHVEKGKHFKQSSFKQEKNGNENRSNFPVSISFTMNCPRRDIYQAVLNNLKRQFNSNCQPINVQQKHFQLKKYFFCSSFILIILQYHDWLIRLQFLPRNQRTLMLIAKTNKYIRVITKLPNSEQSYKGKVKTHKYINRQNQSNNRKIGKPVMILTWYRYI